jgi:alpha-L-fucosidase 2
LQQLFSARNTCPNLFGLHPPMQIDGNFGITAGIAEMLLQSQAGEIELLPALPKEWPTGRISGLRARGGYQINESWRDGKLVSVNVWNAGGADNLTVRYGAKVAKLYVPRGAGKTFDSDFKQMGF